MAESLAEIAKMPEAFRSRARHSARRRGSCWQRKSKSIACAKSSGRWSAAPRYAPALGAETMQARKALAHKLGVSVAHGDELSGHLTAVAGNSSSASIRAILAVSNTDGRRAGPGRSHAGGVSSLWALARRLLTRDAIAGARCEGSGQAAFKAKRMHDALERALITVAGAEKLDLEGVLAILVELAREARRARAEKLDVLTWVKVLRVKAHRPGRPAQQGIPSA